MRRKFVGDTQEGIGIARAISAAAIYESAEWLQEHAGFDEHKVKRDHGKFATKAGSGKKEEDAPKHLGTLSKTEYAKHRYETETGKSWDKAVADLKAAGGERKDVQDLVKLYTAGHHALMKDAEQKGLKAKPTTKTLAAAVKNMGGISFASLEKHGFDTSRLLESGLLVTFGKLIRKSGGRDVEEIARELHEDGAIQIPGVVEHGNDSKTFPQETAAYLMDQLHKKAKVLHANVESEYHSCYARYLQEQHDAEQAGISRDDIAEATRDGEASGAAEAEKGDAWEGHSDVAGTGEDDADPWDFPDPSEVTKTEPEPPHTPPDPDMEIEPRAPRPHKPSLAAGLNEKQQRVFDKMVKSGTSPEKARRIAIWESLELQEQFQEDKHPRDHGKFASSAGGKGEDDAPKSSVGKATDAAKNAYHAIHDIGAAGFKKLPNPVQKAVSLGLATAFAGWTASQKIAERISIEKGSTPEEAAALRSTLAAWDMVAFKPMAVATAPLGAAVGAATWVIPPVTGAYLAHAVVTNPMASYRAAKGLIADAVESVKKTVQDHTEKL